MKETEDNIDLRLALGDSTQFVETILEVNKGVGANAGSKINMAFAASDPLSELVWSPDNGLSLRCADSTLAASKPLLLWNVGPSNLVLSLPENIRTREDNDLKSTEEGPFIVASLGSPVNQNLSKEIGLATSSQRNANPSSNSINPIESINSEKMDLTAESNVMLHHPDNETNNLQNIIISSGTEIDDYNADQADQRNKQCEPVGPLQFISPQQGAKEATADTEQETENKVSNDNSLAVGESLKRMEFSAENELPNLVRTEALEHAAEKVPRENSIHLEASPSKSWMELYQTKGKGKVPSDGHVSVRVSNDLENSHESVESCNKSKRQLDPTESIIDSKRAKREQEDKEAFTSPIRPDSSFMNWISNMVKGYRAGPSLDLRLDHSDWPKENVPDIVVRGKHSEDMCIGTGFQSMFQSLYSPASRNLDVRVSEAEYVQRASEQLLLANSRSGKIPALDYPSENEKCFERSLMANVNTDSATSRNRVPPSQLQIVPLNASPLQEIHETNWGSYKDGSRIFGCPNLLPESKTDNNKPGKKSTLGNLWITRFCPKIESTSLNLNERSQNADRGATDQSRLNYIQVSSEVNSTRNTLGICHDLRPYTTC